MEGPREGLPHIPTDLDCLHTRTNITHTHTVRRILLRARDGPGDAKRLTIDPHITIHKNTHINICAGGSLAFYIDISSPQKTHLHMMYLAYACYVKI